jgi:hypothetical protein
VRRLSLAHTGVHFSANTLNFFHASTIFSVHGTTLKCRAKVAQVLPQRRRDMKRKLTDRGLKALKAAKPGQRYEIADAEIHGLGVRVSDKGQRSFVLVGRFPGSNNPTRRALGEYPTMSLAEARDKARRWRELICRGIGVSRLATRLTKLLQHACNSQLCLGS